MWVRGSRRSADRLDYTTVGVEATDAVGGVLEAAVTDDELTSSQLDRVPRVGHIVSERDGADWIAAMCELFDRANVVTGDQNIVCGRGHRQTTRTVAYRPLRHCPVHLNSIDAVIDVVRNIETPIVAARRHIGETFEIWNCQTPEEIVAVGVEDLYLFSLFPT